MMLITASGLERLSKCTAAGVLPQARSLISSRAASRGTVIHKYLADVHRLGRDGALAAVPADSFKDCEAIDLDELPVDPEKFAPEVAFAYDVTTDSAAELKRGENQRAVYEPREGVIYGTADVVGLTDEEALVFDYKTGRADLLPASELWQLRFYALAAARTYGRQRAKVAIIRVRDDGSPWWEWATFEQDDLESIADELVMLVMRIKEAREHVVPQQAEATLGLHCKYCPSRPYCPAQQGMAARIGQGTPPTVDFKGATHDELAAALQRIQLYRQVMDEAEEQILARAAEEPIPLGNGWVLGKKLQPCTRIDPERAMPLLEQLYGADVANAAVEVKMSMTQAQLERALRVYMARNPGTKITKLKQATMVALKESGAAVVTHDEKVMKHKPKPEALAAGEEAQNGDEGGEPQAA